MTFTGQIVGVNDRNVNAPLKVYIPFLHGPDNSVSVDAAVSTLGGITPQYKVGTMVYVSYPDNNAVNPVVIGLASSAGEEVLSKVSTSSLVVDADCELPKIITFKENGTPKSVDLAALTGLGGDNQALGDRIDTIENCISPTTVTVDAKTSTAYKLNAVGGIVLSPNMFGTTIPEVGVEGQLYFVLQGEGE